MDKLSKLTNKIKDVNSVLLTINFLKWAIIGSIVGLLTGGVIAFFLKSLEYATELRMNWPWLLFLLPIGGAIISYIYKKIGGDSSKGNNLIIDKINGYEGNVPVRMAPLVLLGTITTHLFGGSAGREGTGVQIGASLAELVGRIFKLDRHDKKIILMAGVSGGFSAVFGTPLAGTIFGLEIATVGIVNYSAIIPCFAAAFVGNLVTMSLGINHLGYNVTGIPEITLVNVLKIILCAILFGLLGRTFSKVSGKLKEIFSKKIQNIVIRTFVGGVIIIILTYIVGTRDYLGLSIPLLNESFISRVSPLSFLLKLIFTAITLATGFQGGEVTPLFVMGATFGNMLSFIMNLSPSFLAELGLIGIFSGATNSPITSLVLGIEMFGSRGSGFMLMTCAISYIFSGHSGIYVSQKIVKSKSRTIIIPADSNIREYQIKKKNRNKLSK